MQAAASKEEDSDEEAAVESEVAHRNPFAALEAGGEGSSADSAADSASAHDSDSSSQHSSSSTAEMTHPAADARNGTSSAHFFPENEQQLSELDLAAQRQAVLARLQSGGAAQSATHVALGSRHAANGHMGSGHALYGQLISAQKLKASLGGSQLAVQLVSHLCCPITGVSRPAHAHLREGWSVSGALLMSGCCLSAKAGAQDKILRELMGLWIR